MKSKYFTTALAISFTAMVTGCISTPANTYHWGSYEKVLHDMYLKPGKATPQAQITTLTKDIQQAENLGKPIAPGIYAHLGFMYSLEGNIGAAEDAFNQEKSLYPDSAVLINGMLARSKNNNIK